jgi:two-component system, chemotaxis family, chemotaxis protein CheY
MINGVTQMGTGNLKILIVEDDFYTRRLLQRILSPFGECDIAVNGEEAVDAYKNTLKEEFSYDLICLDILMPVMDGQETLRQLRKIEESAGIYGDNGTKIIMITVMDDNKNILKAFRTGCEGYITKPVDKKKLIAKIAELGLLE